MQRTLLQGWVKLLSGFNFQNYCNVKPGERNCSTWDHHLLVVFWWQLWRHEAWHVVQEHKFLALGRGFWLESHLRSWTKRDLSVSHYLHFSKSPSAQLIPSLAGRNRLPLHLLACQISADALAVNTMLRHEICRACFDFSLSLAKQVWRTGLSRLCFAATNLATGLRCLLECSLSMSQL